MRKTSTRKVGAPVPRRPNIRMAIRNESGRRTTGGPTFTTASKMRHVQNPTISRRRARSDRSRRFVGYPPPQQQLHVGDRQHTRMATQNHAQNINPEGRGASTTAPEHPYGHPKRIRPPYYWRPYIYDRIGDATCAKPHD